MWAARRAAARRAQADARARPPPLATPIKPPRLRGRQAHGGHQRVPIRIRLLAPRRPVVEAGDHDAPKRAAREEGEAQGLRDARAEHLRGARGAGVLDDKGGDPRRRRCRA